MSEIATITTLTDLAVSGENISIKTYYFDITTLPDTIEARIADGDGIQDGVSFKKGDLLLKEKNSPEHLSYIIDGGHLIITLNTGDILNYSIDSNGHLIYTITE